MKEVDPPPSSNIRAGKFLFVTLKHMKNKYKRHLIGGAIALLISLLIASALQGQVMRSNIRERIDLHIPKPSFLHKKDYWYVPAVAGAFISGYAGGKAEFIRYHQDKYTPGTYYYMDPGGEYETVWNDGFHAYRDAGLLTLGGSVTCLTLSFKQDKWWKVLAKVAIFTGAYSLGTKTGYHR